MIPELALQMVIEEILQAETVNPSMMRPQERINHTRIIISNREKGRDNTKKNQQYGRNQHITFGNHCEC